MHDRAVPEASFCDEIANIFPSFPKETRDKWIRIYLADQALDALIRHGMNLSQARIQSGCRSSLLPKIRTIAQKMNPGIVKSHARGFVQTWCPSCYRPGTAIPGAFVFCP